MQTILKEAGTSNDQEIPVPPPQPSEIKYDELYPSTFQQTASYIRFSQTVEECISCAYDMTTEDDDFLKKYSDKKGIPRLSEDDFERIMEVFEDMASETTPFASIDNTVVSYDMMVPSLNALGEAKLMLHAKPVYEYWKSRRQATGNKPLHPTLKFELHQDTDDADPYVCFRRREARQTRKTRQRDVQSADKLKKLRKELEDGRQLIINAYEREMLKRDSLLVERDIFEHRAKLKAMKIRLGIKNEDEDLINQKVRDSPENSDPTASHPRLILRSPRSASQPMCRPCSALQACACPSGPMGGPWMPTLCSLPRSWPRRRTSCVPRSSSRSRPIASGTRTTSTLRATPYRRSRSRAWRLPSGPPRPSIS